MNYPQEKARGDNWGSIRDQIDLRKKEKEEDAGAWIACYFFIIFCVAIICLVLFFVWLFPVKLNELHYGRAKFEVKNAWLTQFNIMSDHDNYNNLTHILQYQVIMNITATNPYEEARYGIFYEDIEAHAYYNNQLLGTTSLGPVFVEASNPTALTAIFTGTKLIVIGANEVSEIKNDISTGIYGIQVKLIVISNNEWELHRYTLPKYQITCNLKVPLGLEGSKGTNFNFTECYYN